MNTMLIVYILCGIIAILLLILFVQWMRHRKTPLTNINGIFSMLKETPKRITKTEYYDDNQSIKMTYECIGNDKDGTEELFFPSGKLNRTRVWHRGVLHGEMTVYYESGNVYIKGNYKKGSLTGEYTVYKENGNILTVKRY